MNEKEWNYRYQIICHQKSNTHIPLYRDLIYTHSSDTFGYEDLNLKILPQIETDVICY